MMSTNSYLTLVDAHVHLYSCFDPKIFLDAAHRNFTNMGNQLNIEDSIRGILLLSETSQDNMFEKMRVEADQIKSTGYFQDWSFFKTCEPMSLIAKRSDGAELIIIAGQQM